MSSRPGTSLEKFAMWNFNVIVDGDDSGNLSLQIAERLGTATRRRNELTTEAFKRIIIDPLEPHRVHIEYYLEDFDEENQSWRDYAGSVDWYPEALEEVIRKNLKDHFDAQTTEIATSPPTLGLPGLGESAPPSPSYMGGFLDAGIPTDNPLSDEVYHEA